MLASEPCLCSILDMNFGEFTFQRLYEKWFSEGISLL